MDKLQQFPLIVLGFGQIFLYLLCGKWLSNFIPFPATIIAMLLCCGVCFYLNKVPKSLDIVSRLLLKNMAIFFIPYVVTINLFWPTFADFWFTCLSALFISTLLTLFITSTISDKLINTIKNKTIKDFPH